MKDVVDLDRVYFSRGESNYNRGYYIEALEDFKKIHNAALYGRKHNNIGMCYYQLGLYEYAEKHYNKTIESDTEDPTVYYNLAALYVKQNKNDRAKVILQNDKKSQDSIEAYKRFKKSETIEQGDWYDWWFKDGGSKMTLGSILLFTILSLIVVITFVSLVDNRDQIDMFNPLHMDVAKSSVLVIIVSLLIAILLLPSLKKVKVGQVELDTSPIHQKEIELLEPKISYPLPEFIRISPKSTHISTPIIKLYRFGKIRELTYSLTNEL
jgi:tetratricopeptide (TPR) repeat protein